MFENAWNPAAGKVMIKIVDDKEFSDLLHLRSQVLLANAMDIVGAGAENFVLTRPLLTMLQAESSQLEELLDAYGARHSQTWYHYRMHIAMLKNFSTAGYELLHLRHSVHSYDFRVDVSDFSAATDSAICYVAAFLHCTLKQLLDDVRTLPMPDPEPMTIFDYSEHLPEGVLRNDRPVALRETPQELVTRLATSFLNSTEDAGFLDKAARSRAPEWRGLDFERLSEASIRDFEEKFHSLQSLYDTYVSYTTMEGNDASLRQLRGLISVVLHLLKVLTIFIHFYERHIIIQGDELFCRKNCVLGGVWYLELIAHYLCHYSHKFLVVARGVCQHMLQRYAIIGTVEVPVPPYFGFHVRPSTLISAIVRHYGSDVKMILDKEYDASIPMNLFLANEWINQLKRQHVGAELVKMADNIKELQSKVDNSLMGKVEAVSKIIKYLATVNLIRVLVYPLKIDQLVHSSTAQNLLELAQSVIANLHAQRHININYSINAKFRGDIRVLDDIKLLAKYNYGENEYGSNIALPPELSYLSYSRPSA